MASVAEHYDQTLAEIYSWMHGGFNAGIQKNIAFFKPELFAPKSSAIALDLGAGCGFQSIPLAKLGYSIIAIDLNSKLLAELQKHAGNLPIQLVQDDLLNFGQTVNDNLELVVCMTDTLLHLETKEQVALLFSKVFSALEPGGQFVMSFRDLSKTLEGTDRFLPIRSEKNCILSCFLEYELETVKVYDIIYRYQNANWKLYKSFYHKLRVSQDWVVEQLIKSGFKKMNPTTEAGFVTITASK